MKRSNVQPNMKMLVEIKLTKIFQQERLENSDKIALEICQKIMVRNKQVAHIKLWLVSVVGLLSSIGLVPAFKILLNDLATSGFYEYSSLTFSDGKMIMVYWKEFILLLAESLPVLSIILALTLIFILFLSLKYGARQIVQGQLLLS